MESLECAGWVSSTPLHTACAVHSKAETPSKPHGARCALPLLSCRCFVTVGTSEAALLCLSSCRRTFPEELGTSKEPRGWELNTMHWASQGPTSSEASLESELHTWQSNFCSFQEPRQLGKVSWIGFCPLYHCKALPAPVSRTFPINESTKKKTVPCVLFTSLTEPGSLAVRDLSLFQHCTLSRFASGKARG